MGRSSQDRRFTDLSDSTADAPSSDERVGFADPYTRYVMAIMFAVYVMSYIDRQLASVLLEDMKHDLGASDA